MPDLDITLGARSDASGRFNLVAGADGDVAFDETSAHAVVTSATELRGSWWADPEHGWRGRTLRNLTSATPSQASAATLEAIEPLERENQVTDVEVVAEAERVAGQRTGRLLRRVRWTTPAGETVEREV